MAACASLVSTIGIELVGMHGSSNLCMDAASGVRADGRLLPTLQIDLGGGKRQLRNCQRLDCSHVPSVANCGSGQGDLLATFRADDYQGTRKQGGCATKG
jgi:hypothetical protein